jgi:hypothetical protein
MLLRFMYSDGTYDMVKASRLDQMIATGRVTKFLRKDGWVDIGKGVIRSRIIHYGYQGPERRVNG